MGKKILIVDDEKDWAHTMAIRLERAGYQAEVAFDPAQAMERAVNSKPDLMLLDIMMPAGGGLKVLENMRSRMKTFSIPVIIITGMDADKETKEAEEKFGISGYFMKPVDMEVLLVKLKEVLAKERKKILIVDDEEDWVRVLAIRLERSGYQVAVAFDAAQAMEQAIQLKPDLIFLDIMLPAGGGLKVLETIRKNPRTLSVPVIVITGKEWDGETRIAAGKLGVFGYFIKPVNMDELLEKLKGVLTRE